MGICCKSLKKEDKDIKINIRQKKEGKNNEEKKDDIEKSTEGMKKENNNEENLKEEKKQKEDYILASYLIKKQDIGEIIQILNCNENEEEIKNACELYITDNKTNKSDKLEFNFRNQFQKADNYEIKLLFIKPLSNASDLFYSCSKLKKLNLSDFNMNNITNMNSMFSGCTSLEEIDL